MSTAGITTSSISGITTALSQVDQIEQQLAQLSDGALLTSVSGGAASAGSALSQTSAENTTTSGFADALSQAELTDPASATTSGVADNAATSSTLTDPSLLSGALSSSGDSSAESELLADYSGATGGAGFVSGASAAGVTLPASASTLLTTGQQKFASTLSADTGLSPGVVTSWLLAEESGGAADSRQSAGNNDWLNVGYTDSATYGAGDSIWSDPVTAATATANWLKGQDSIPGYGAASSGIQSILDSVGQTPQVQIAALHNSGWASSGYPDLTNLYARVTGTNE